MNIIIKLPSGRRVFHGTFKDGIFTREIAYNAIRWSDRAFCLNKVAVPQLKKLGCKEIHFILNTPEVAKRYKVPFEKIDNFELATTETNEENYRFPIDKFNPTS